MEYLPRVQLNGSVTAVAAGEEHTCAIVGTGDVKCFGRGEYGALGYDNTDNVGYGSKRDLTSIPMAQLPAVDLGERATAVCAGDKHSCALLRGGLVKCWGKGTVGRLGHDRDANVGDGGSGSVPLRNLSAVALGKPAVTISCGSSHNCAVLEGGAIKCWG